MTLSELEQIPNIKSEIIMLKNRLQKMHKSGDYVVDFANDYSSGTAHPITLKGYAISDDKRREGITKRIVKLENKILEAAKFIDTIPDSKIRILLIVRFLDGLTWEHAAKMIYKKMSADAARKCISRYFDNDKK